MTVTAPTVWRSADCRVGRHGSCVMARSCACECHHSRVEKLRALRARVAADLAVIDEEIAQLEGRSTLTLVRPRGRPRKPGSAACEDSIVASVQLGEEVKAAAIINRVCAGAPGRWDRASIATTIALAATHGRLQRVTRGIYRLP